jgi:transposase
MAGRFEGLSDLEWYLFADIFRPEPTMRARGMPHTPFRKVVNTLLDVPITGCRWAISHTVPYGRRRVSRIGSRSAGKRMVLSRRYKPGCWGLQRNTG